MANYPKIMTTYEGLSLISETVAAGKALVFTKIMLGDGDMGEQDLRALTALLSPKMTLPVTGGTDLGNGQVQIRATVSNDSLDAGFFAKEVGVYAKSGKDGPEKLIAYTNGGNYVDYIPDKNTPIDSQTFKVDVVVGNASEVKIQVADETFLTKAELDAHNADPDAHAAAKDKHNKDENAHSGILQKISTLGDDIIKRLALTTTIAAISTLQTNSWFGQLLKMVLNASGVKYNIQQNGYICLGSFFGGLIIQWGISNLPYDSSSPQTVTLPMSYTEKHLTTVAVNHTSTSSLTDDMAGRHIVCTVIGSFTLTGFSVSFVQTPSRVVSFISVGK